MAGKWKSTKHYVIYRFHGAIIIGLYFHSFYSHRRGIILKKEQNSFWNAVAFSSSGRSSSLQIDTNVRYRLFHGMMDGLQGVPRITVEFPLNAFFSGTQVDAANEREQFCKLSSFENVQGFPLWLRGRRGSRKMGV